MNRRKLKNKDFRPKTKKEKRNGPRNKINRLPANSSNIFSSIIFDNTPDESAIGVGPKSMYFHQRNTGERAKTFIGTYLVTNFSYEGAIANRMRYDHFERCFFKVVRTLKKLDWKNIFACVKPKEIVAAENELNEALREDGSLANTIIPRFQRAIENPKCSEDSLVSFTNQITAAERRRKELKPIIETLQTALKSEEDKFQPYHNIDEQIEMLQNNPQAEDLRLRAKADIMKILTRIGLVFGINRDKGKEITATINFADGLVRTIKFYPQKYYAEIDHGKGKPEIVKFDHGHHPSYKLTEADAREVYRLYDHGNGICQKEIAPMMGVTRGVIYNILSGKQYPHLYKELNGSPPMNIGNRGKHKLGEKEVLEIWRIHLDGMIQPEICKVMGVSGVTLSNVLTGKRFYDLYIENKLKPRKNRFLNGKSQQSYRCRGS
jgi:hypothetical protein